MENAAKKILIVEDDQFLREFYQELLTENDYLIDVSSDGEDCLRRVAEKDYDLILLDVMMPRKDGIAVLTELKNKNFFKDKRTQVVMLTNLGQDQMIKQCFELGAQGYLIKSALNPEQVLDEVKKLLQEVL